ncbi:MAG TPA: dihydropteroate synthase [Solibacterales bacterium]|nr:dihydropteroate synthase [Bryobacterales bacterium]
MKRRRFEWRLKQREISLGDRTLIVGVLPVTPDAFADPDRAFARAIEIEEHGADVLALGAEPLFPGAPRISEAEELRRLVPVLKRLKDKLAIPIAVETYKSAVAEKSLEHGAEIIEDPSGLTFDPALAKAVVKYDAGLVLAHLRGTPETWTKLPPLPDVMGGILHDLEAAVNRARRSGVQRNAIAIDPGLGYGKRKEQNVEIVARLHELARLDLPTVVGTLGKAFLAQGSDEAFRFAAAGGAAAASLAGANLIRTYEPREAAAATAVADAVAAARARLEENQ